tara:strand:+ start:270 stop:875 length:606 start_codon:yes stop_codon:yes gene_type:complete
MSSDIKSTFIEAATADRNGVCAAQTPSGSGNLTINGALSDGGAVTFDQARQVTVYGGSDESAKTFTITGTDETGTAATETITGPNATTATGSTYFATITQVAVDAATTGAVEIGSGANISAPIFKGRLRLRGIYAVNTGTAGTITFREGSSSGTVNMKFNTVASANTTQYPDIPDDGILFISGGYVLYGQTTLSSLTLFYS